MLCVVCFGHLSAACFLNSIICLLDISMQYVCILFTILIYCCVKYSVMPIVVFCFCFFSNRSLLAGHVGFFPQFVAITNNSAPNIHVLACLCVDVGDSLGQTLRSGNAGPMLNFSRCYQITVQNGCTISHAHPQWHEITGLSTLSLTLGVMNL